MSEVDELDSEFEDAWPAMPPPEGFADRVLAARKPRWRLPLVVMGVIAAAATMLLLLLRGHTIRGGHGEIAATTRTTTVLADRGVAVAEANAHVRWRVDASGAAELEQREGDVFYRVEHGGPFVVHTPAGDVRVTGTCLRIEVEPMKPSKQMIVGGVIGAAPASAVTVTVYEGLVTAESKTARTDLVAGTRTTLGESASPQGTRAMSAESGPHEMELARLRRRIAELEKHTDDDAKSVEDSEQGRPWYSPSHERLVEWAASCRVRFDEPSLEDFTPQTAEQAHVEPAELEGYNAAIGAMAKQWKDSVRTAYIDTTGDTAGPDTLSLSTMLHELKEKGPPDEYAQVIKQIAAERAGLATPPDLAKASALERLIRAQAALGDESEAALAAHVGAARAKAIRGDGWGNRSDMQGCPR